MVLTITIIKDKLDIFHAVKTIPFAEVVSHFEGQIPDRKGKILCPFHEESKASFQVYEDSGYCFGCLWSGDSIAFISQLEGLRPFEAALLIAEKFDLSSGTFPTEQEQRKINQLKIKQTMAKKYLELERKAFFNMANFRSLVMRTLDNIGIDDIDPIIEKAVHMLPEIEDYMMSLADRDYKKRIQLLYEGVITKWARE